MTLLQEDYGFMWLGLLNDISVYLKRTSMCLCVHN